MGVLGQNDIWVLVPWLSTKYTIRGKVVAFPKSRPWWVLWVRVCSWFVRAPKCSNYALINLLFGLCRFVWVIELFVNLPSPISELQHTPLPLKCYEPRSMPLYPWNVANQGARPNSFPFCCFHLWTCNWVHQGAWGCVIRYWNVFIGIPLLGISKSLVLCLLVGIWNYP